MLIKHHEKQLSFHVLNLLADYARTMQHSQILQRGSHNEVELKQKNLHRCIVWILNKKPTTTFSRIK